MLILDLMAQHVSKKVGTQTAKDNKMLSNAIKYLLEHLATNLINLQQVSNPIGYKKKSISESLKIS